MTGDELILANQLSALIATKTAEIAILTELLADDEALATVLVIVTATGYSNVTVGDATDGRTLLDTKKSALEAELAELQEQFDEL